MRRFLTVVLGAVAVSTLGPSSSVLAQQPTIKPAHTPAVICPEVTAGDPSAPPIQSSATSPGAQVLTVRVPAFVFISRSHGSWVVKTNANAVRPAYSFYVLSPGHARPAAAHLKALVLATCS